MDAFDQPKQEKRAMDLLISHPVKSGRRITGDSWIDWELHTIVNGTILIDTYEVDPLRDDEMAEAIDDAFQFSGCGVPAGARYYDRPDYRVGTHHVLITQSGGFNI